MRRMQQYLSGLCAISVAGSDSGMDSDLGQCVLKYNVQASVCVKDSCLEVFVYCSYWNM